MVPLTKCQTCKYCVTDYHKLYAENDPCGLDLETGFYKCLGLSGDEYRNYERMEEMEVVS